VGQVKQQPVTPLLKVEGPHEAGDAVQVAASATANQTKVRVLAKAGRNWETIPHQADQSGANFSKIMVAIVVFICYPMRAPNRTLSDPDSHSWALVSLALVVWGHCYGVVLLGLSCVAVAAVPRFFSAILPEALV
jgi:hypothetical protein